jgi:small subunit ribosomal protein S20
MPNIKSAIKRVKTSEKARERNHARKSAFRTATKRVERMLGTGETDGIAVAASQAISAIDRAAKTRAIHPAQAARRKSRLMLKLNAAMEGGVTLEAQPKNNKAAKAKPATKTPKTTAKAKASGAKPVAKKSTATKKPASQQ